MRTLDVLSFGEALVDLLPDRCGRLRDCEQFQVFSGGAPANVAVGLARLGRRVGFCGVLGEDELGHLLERKLGEEGLRCFFRFSAEAKTGIWFIALDERGDRTFFAPIGPSSADKLLGPADVARAPIAQARWLHCGSSAHVQPAGQAALREAVKVARAAGTRVSFDPNVRAHLWRDPRELRALCEDVFPFCDLVKLSVDELEACMGETDPELAAERLADRGVRLACITLGEHGALVRQGPAVLHVAAPRVQVVDTTGAGDGFVAGLLSRLSAQDAELPMPALRQAVAFACAVGSRVCTRLGATSGLPRAGEAAELTLPTAG